MTDYNHTKEIDTGDAYDFRPVTSSICYNYFATGAIPAALGGPFDESQSQFIDEKTYSQELRFTSNKVGGFSWIAGAYFVHTERFISTGNLVDRGEGIPRGLSDAAGGSRTIRSRPIPTSRSWPTRRTTTPGRCSAMRPTSSTSNGSSMPRSATTRTSARTPPIRRQHFLPDPTASYRGGAQRHLGCGAAQGHAALQAE